ncbi:Flp family type IVb pilin [Vibrio porteresiae]|uniref:Flp family type IVb pilin n=1 Tax=Vibrio porteresiae DSM 19223 TaxID=1123496 RepID=A0ABZ0QKG3_9VIBR|nr:Flp family type IVb pilin [Vibrio porteresiae]WPC76975.1 Flp family type IVb pilin [Vibrio porteresiae DSM 19223]
MLMNLSCKLYSNIVAFAQDKRGVTAIEYAIIGVAISAIVYTMFNGTLKGALTGAMTTISNKISSASSI